MKRKMLLFLLLLSPLSSSLFLLLLGSMVCTDLGINNADELINLKNSVTRENTYSGTTVLLSSDIDFSGKTFEPIGLSFNGVFDGQGHVISNLTMASSSHYVDYSGTRLGWPSRMSSSTHPVPSRAPMIQTTPVYLGSLGGATKAAGLAQLRAA